MRAPALSSAPPLREIGHPFIAAAPSAVAPAPAFAPLPQPPPRKRARGTALFGAFGMLLVFHIYLVYRQLTTYDFLIEMRNTQREQQTTQAREPAGAVTNADPKRVGPLMGWAWREARLAMQFGKRNAATPEEKKPFEDLAAEDKQRYNREVREFRETATEETLEHDVDGEIE